MAAAVILTAKGEFDLAILAHFSPWIAWMFPVMLDVYVVTAFHRRRWKDMVVGMLLMIFCQVAVHVLPVFITAGEQTPWGLVVAVACVAPIVVVRVKILTGRTRQEIAADDEAARQAEELRQARADTAAVRRELAETRTRAEAEMQARENAETAASEAEMQTAQAETRAAREAEIRADVERAAQAQAETEAEIRAEISARAQAEISAAERATEAAVEAARAAQQRAAEQAELARLAEGRLAEARDAADRAAEARVAAEQRATATVRQASMAAEQAERDLRQQLTAVGDTASTAQRQARELAGQVAALGAQLEEARAAGERQSIARVCAEQQLAEAEQARTALLNELERVRRQLARASEQVETKAEISRGPDRKFPVAVPVRLPENLPVVETVRPEKVATVLVARVTYPDATLAQLAEMTKISDRTIGKVLRAVPAEIAGEVGQVLALTDGKAAA
ncbi:hypothetical protein BG844_09585 [Couchioplanes caeruleus subsp. caeruleus]|uniref:Uncharacterized protein n=2 Tax=Couchioplanes caeruleus TaxID=56438 RepID=A0A1K0GQ11_9ACTN|nr:hypothetical protein BG844_09585 [Couchioplanes caeruleus subsp. caeruleus]